MKLLYGNVALHHGFCAKCDSPAFAADDLCCVECGTRLELDRRVKRVSAARYKRRKPSAGRQEEILTEQNNRCYWCRGAFGSALISPRGLVRTLKAAWDHFIPYSYTGSCADLEFVASCQVCNGIKSASMFDTEEECRGHIMRRRAQKGWSALEGDLSG